MFEHHGLSLEGEGAPAGGAPGAGGAVADPPLNGEQPEKEEEQTVPLAVLLDERRKFKARERELLGKIPDRPAPAEPAEEKGPLTPEEVEKWEKHLSSLPIGKKLLAAVKELEELKAETGSHRVAAKLATDMFHDRLAFDAEQHYDAKTMPVEREVWHKIVAAEMTDERLGRLYAGDPKAWPEIIAAAKKGLVRKAGEPVKSQVDLQKEREANKVRRLPATPGAGGTPPASPEPERLVGKALHDRAFARLQDAKARKE